MPLFSPLLSSPLLSSPLSLPFIFFLFADVLMSSPVILSASRFLLRMCMYEPVCQLALSSLTGERVCLSPSVLHNCLKITHDLRRHVVWHGFSFSGTNTGTMDEWGRMDRWGV